MSVCTFFCGRLDKYFVKHLQFRGGQINTDEAALCSGQGWAGLGWQATAGWIAMQGSKSHKGPHEGLNERNESPQGPLLGRRLIEGRPPLLPLPHPEGQLEGAVNSNYDR